MAIRNDQSSHHCIYPVCSAKYSMGRPIESLKAIFQTDQSHSSESMFELFKIAIDAKKISEETYLQWEPRFRNGYKEFEWVEAQDVLGNVAWSFSPIGALALFIKVKGGDGLPDKIQRFTAEMPACNFSIRADERNDFEFCGYNSRKEILPNVSALLDKGYLKILPMAPIYLAADS